ncbi:hypothetical protein VNI00_017190 [Paramarasmius palmivorus]|uniref:Xylanolytic transcriptional activator regulatory domain-containing protein n=1 Tax=Paramarasmius palmivorus TaxID=297713 RepID=A0AAW0B6U4_9AGAR
MPTSINHTSLAIPLDELATTWLNELEPDAVPSHYPRKKKRLTTMSTNNTPGRGLVKSEPAPIPLRDLRITSDTDAVPVQSLLPSTSAYYTTDQHTLPPGPRVTAELLSLLPPLEQKSSLGPSSNTFGTPQNPAVPHFTGSARTTSAYLQEASRNSTTLAYDLRRLLRFAEDAVSARYPWLNWNVFRDRVEAFVRCLSEPVTQQRKDKAKSRREKEEQTSRAMQIFGISSAPSSIGKKDRSNRTLSSSSPLRNTHHLFPPSSHGGSSTSPFNDGPNNAGSSAKGKQKATSAEAHVEMNLPFFAMICISIAIGIGEAKQQRKWTSLHFGAHDSDDRMQVDTNMEASASHQPDAPNFSGRMDPTYWYHLSNQAMSLWESDRPSTASSMTQNNAVDGVDDMDVVNDSGSVFPASRKANSVNDLSEMEMEMDRMSTLLLQVTFLCHGGLRTEDASDLENGETNESDRERRSVNRDIVPLMGKIVALARQMRLHVDPDEHGSEEPSPSTEGKKKDSKQKSRDLRDGRGNSFSLFESEMRRRIWWCIMFYDLFVSDLSTLPPLITDGTFSTKVPVANVDETVFCPDSVRITPPPGGGADGKGWTRESMRGLEARCQLVQLVRSIKKKMNGPTAWHGSYHGSYSIEQAASMEQDVKAWLDSLPKYYQVNAQASTSPSPSPSPTGTRQATNPLEPPIAVLEDSAGLSSDSIVASGEEDPVLAVQRCELAIVAHRLILRIYLPFLKRNANGPVLHQATLGSINAAHGVICACQMLWSVWEAERSKAGKPPSSLPPSSLLPASCDFYPFARTVFDAAVVCSHAVIKQTLNIISKPALDDVDIGLGILRSVAGWTDDAEGEATWRQGIKCDRQGIAGSEYIVPPSEAVKIVEGLREQAGGPSNPIKGFNASSGSKPQVSASHSHVNSVGSSSSASASDVQSPTLKRKHIDDENESELRRKSPGPPVMVSPLTSVTSAPAYVYPSIPPPCPDTYTPIHENHTPTTYTSGSGPLYSISAEPDTYPAPPPPPAPVLSPGASLSSSQPSPTISSDGSSSSKSSSKSKKPSFGIRVRSPKDAVMPKTPIVTNDLQSSIGFARGGEVSSLSPHVTGRTDDSQQQMNGPLPLNPSPISTGQEQHEHAYRPRTSSIAHAEGAHQKYEPADYSVKPLPFSTGPTIETQQSSAMAHHQQSTLGHEIYSSQDALPFTPQHEQAFSHSSPSRYDHPREPPTYPPTQPYNPPRKNSIDTYAAESPYGASGQLSNASSPYTTSTPSFGPPSHGASPQGYASTSPAQYYAPESSNPYPQTRYDGNSRYSGGNTLAQAVTHAPPSDRTGPGPEAYSGTGSGEPQRHTVYSIAEGAAVVYDVKPSMESLNQQQQQQYPTTTKHPQQHAYHHGYNTTHTNSENQGLMPAMSTSQSWPQVPQEGHYWNTWGES